MQVVQMEWWHLALVVIASLAAGNGLQASIRSGWDYLRGRFFTPEPGPTQKELLQSLHSRLAGIETQIAPLTFEAQTHRSVSSSSSA